MVQLGDVIINYWIQFHNLSYLLWIIIFLSLLKWHTVSYQAWAELWMIAGFLKWSRFSKVLKWSQIKPFQPSYGVVVLDNPKLFLINYCIGQDYEFKKDPRLFRADNTWGFFVLLIKHDIKKYYDLILSILILMYVLLLIYWYVYQLVDEICYLFV